MLVEPQTGTPSDVEELHTTSSECSSSSGEESEEEDDQGEGAQKSDFPGDRTPRGADLPDRGRHICRMAGCSKIYRWPDYFCGDHGGGRCQHQHWVEGQAPCTRFHQSRNSRGEDRSLKLKDMARYLCAVLTIMYRRFECWIMSFSFACLRGRLIGELLCGAHSRMINASYGEEKRKPKGPNGVKASKVKKTVTHVKKATKGRSRTCA